MDPMLWTDVVEFGTYKKKAGLLHYRGSDYVPIEN